MLKGLVWVVFPDEPFATRVTRVVIGFAVAAEVVSVLQNFALRKKESSEGI